MKLNKYFLIPLMLVIFWAGLIQSIIVGNDFDYYFPKTLNDLVTSPLTWREFFSGDGLGEYTVPTLWSWPIVFITAFLSKLGFDYTLLTKILFLIPIILLSFHSMKKLTNFYSISSWPQIISVLFYSVNSYILLLIDGGQLGLALAYGLFPLAFVSFKKYINSPQFSKLLIATFFICVLSVFDIRIIFLLLILIVLDGFFEIFIKREPKKIVSFLKIGFITIIFLVGIHLYWLLPSINSKAPQLPPSYNRESQVESLSFATITHSLYLVQPHWFENEFGQIKPVRFEFMFIPILVFVAAFLRRKSLDVAFWLIVAVVSIFLAKGSNEPLSSIYGWLFKNIPLFSIFRDPTKFFFLVCLAFSVLIGISSKEIGVRLARFPKMKVSFFVLVVGYLLFLSKPLWLGQMSGLFSEANYKKEFLQFANFLSKQENFSRILWIPKKASLGYASSNHPPVDGLKLVQKRPFAIGVLGTYETLNFLREASYSGQLLDIAGVSHIVYPYLENRRDDLSLDSIKYYYTFLDQLSHLEWTKGRNAAFLMPVIDTREYQDRLFLVPNIWWIIGSDDLYKRVVEDSSLKLSKNALIFADEHPGLGKRLSELKDVKVVLNKKTLLDLAASFIDSSKFIFPAKILDFHPDSSGWWKREGLDLISWRDFLKNKYGFDNLDFDLSGGWAIAEGNRNLLVKDNKLRVGKILLARALESSRSGQLTFSQNDRVVGKISTKLYHNRESNVRWFEVGKLLSDFEIKISTQGDINVLNSLAFLSEEEWIKYKEKSEEIQTKNLISNFERSKLKECLASIQFERINSAKYKINIRNVTEPCMLVFSQNYDYFWQLNGKTPYPLYSFLNGYLIEKDGDYTLEFKPQTYVAFGEILSFLSLGILILLIIYSCKVRS